MISTSLLFTGCASRQTPLPVETPVVNGAPTPFDDEIVITHGLDDEQSIESLGNPMLANITDPWQLIELAQDKPVSEANILRLHAVDLFLEQRHFSTAFSMLEDIDTASLNQEQRIYHSLLEARYAMLSGDMDRATSMLEEIISYGTMGQTNYQRLLELDIAIGTAQQAFKRSLISRLNLDPLLDEAAQLENQRQILNLLIREPDLRTSFDPSEQDDVLKGWLALASLKQDDLLNKAQIRRWQQLYPGHPAQIDALESSARSGPVSSNQIALLLPLTSKLGRAAQAFKAGFDAAVRQDGRFDSSRVYDFGSEAALIPFYYQSAVNDGADFIIGPLGRNSVQALLSYLGGTPAAETSTMILGELTQTQQAIPNLWGFSLSPEQDAAAVAEQAISMGMRQALVMEKNNAWGARVSNAFTEAFETLGGKVVASQRFLPSQGDHSAEVRSLLNINASETRHARLQDQLGTKLHFSVRRRDDVDFIFLAGNTKDARKILPLVKFYRAHKLPIYATSSASGRKFNKFTDEDLKGLHFADLPWLLNALTRATGVSNTGASNTGVTSPDRAALSAPKLPYSNSTLNRLWALGYTAFEAIPQLMHLQADDQYQLQTRMMMLKMDANRNLIHDVAWGKYTENNISILP